MRVFTKVFSGLALSLALAACGGGSSSANSGSSGSSGSGGPGGTGSGSGSLTISNASPSSLNGTCSASNITSTTTGVYVNRQATLSCGASSKLSFIIDTSTNALVDGDTTITLTDAGTGVMALCSGAGGNCPQVSLDAGAKKLSFASQTYAAGGISFTVNGSVTY